MNGLVTRAPDAIPQRPALAPGADARQAKLAEAFQAVSRFFRQSGFTVLLLGAYLAAFEYWRTVDREQIKLSGLLFASLLALGLVWGSSRKLFVNRWDLFIHASVILDLFVESQFIPLHEDRSFYLCALAFAMVLAGYRRLCHSEKRGLARTFHTL